MSKEPVIKAPSKTEFLESFCSTPNIIKQRKFFFRAQSGYCTLYEKKISVTRSGSLGTRNYIFV